VPKPIKNTTPKPDSVPVAAQERLARDRRQAQQAAEALQQALDDLGLPEDLVTEIAGRLYSQQKLLGKIVGVMSMFRKRYINESWDNVSLSCHNAWLRRGFAEGREGRREGPHDGEHTCMASTP
jgi:hypothetical protein